MTWKEALQAVFSAKARHARRERNIATAVWDESPQLHEIVTAKEENSKGSKDWTPGSESDPIMERREANLEERSVAPVEWCKSPDALGWTLACGELRRYFRYDGNVYRARITTIIGDLQHLFNAALKAESALIQDADRITKDLKDGRFDVSFQIGYEAGVVTVEFVRLDSEDMTPEWERLATRLREDARR
jgi:hypothetical protein